MTLTLLQVDAFTHTPFGGNPAAVCILPDAAPDAAPAANAIDDRWMQQIAQEMNLSETAFLVKQADGYSLRWFTPTVEVPLCGHATLASAHALWSEGYVPPTTEIRFHTRSGMLTATQQGDWIELNFPANPSRDVTIPAKLIKALGDAPVCDVWQNSLGYLVLLNSEAAVRQMQPDFALMAELPVEGVLATSLASPPYDFVSRFFAPRLGINEDPVTGAAHCCLAPFWRDRLNQSEFLAYQASARGGVVKVRCEGDRVVLGGQAVTVLRGSLLITF
jgi:PhzF family phenazine biosynthesis protein